MALTSSGKTRKRFLTLSWTPQPLAGWRLLGLLALVGLFLGGLVGTAVAKPNVLKETITFDMVRSAAAQTQHFNHEPPTAWNTLSNNEL